MSGDMHPESYCHRCGGPNRVWCAPSPLWNAVMRDSINGSDEFDGIVCPTCFIVLAEERGIVSVWRLDTDKAYEVVVDEDGRVVRTGWVALPPKVGKTTLLAELELMSAEKP